MLEGQTLGQTYTIDRLVEGVRHCLRKSGGDIGNVW